MSQTNKIYHEIGEILLYQHTFRSTTSYLLINAKKRQLKILHLSGILAHFCCFIICDFCLLLPELVTNYDKLHCMSVVNKRNSLYNITVSCNLICYKSLYPKHMHHCGNI